LLPLAWLSTVPDLNIFCWRLLNNVLRTVVELSHKNRTLHNIRDADHFFSEAHEVDLQWNLQISHSRLVASMLKSLFLIDYCLPSTIQTIHGSLLAKAVRFTIEEFATRNKKVYTIVNYLLKLCFEIFLQNRHCIEIPHIIAYWWNCLHKHSRYHMTLAYSSCLIKLRNQRLVVRRRPSGPLLTASRFYIWVYFLNWWSLSICIRPDSGLVSWNDNVSYRMIEI